MSVSTLTSELESGAPWPSSSTTTRIWIGVVLPRSSLKVTSKNSSPANPSLGLYDHSPESTSILASPEVGGEEILKLFPVRPSSSWTSRKIFMKFPFFEVKASIPPKIWVGDPLSFWGWSPAILTTKELISQLGEFGLLTTSSQAAMKRIFIVLFSFSPLSLAILAMKLLSRYPSESPVNADFWNKACWPWMESEL